MCEIRIQLQQIVLDDPPNKLELFNDLIEKLARENSIQGILTVTETALGEGMSLCARPLLQTVAKNLPLVQQDCLLNLATQILELLRTRLVSFEEEDLQIREHLSKYYLDQNQYGHAARTLT